MQDITLLIKQWRLWNSHKPQNLMNNKERKLEISHGHDSVSLCNLQSRKFVGKRQDHFYYFYFLKHESLFLKFRKLQQNIPIF